jgi:molecular chaperone DnaK
MGGVRTSLIDKNTTIPTKASQVFSTAEDNQNAVTIHVLQGEREMAAGNKSLGRFELSDIPPAQRGTPQIEVSFDIDANGIMHVSAKDKATGKENKIVIKSSSGLSDEEIQEMVADAEAHAEEDALAKALVEAKNQAESMVNGVTKTMADAGDKLDADEKTAIEAAIAEVEEAVKGDDVEAINAKVETLMQASHKLAEQMYAGAEGQEGGAQEQAPEDDNVVDAEFEEVNEDVNDEDDKKA